MGKGHFSGQSAKKGKGRGAKGSGRYGVHEGTGGAPIIGRTRSFGPITREYSQQAINIQSSHFVRGICFEVKHKISQ